MKKILGWLKNNLDEVYLIVLYAWLLGQSLVSDSLNLLVMFLIVAGHLQQINSSIKSSRKVEYEIKVK